MNSPMDKSLKKVATFDTPTAAGFVRSRLEAEGIPVFTENLETVGVAWHLGTAVGGIKLQVPEEELEHALRVLEDMDKQPPIDESYKPEDAEIYEEESVRDMSGHESKPESANELVDRAFRCAILGVLFFPLQIYTLWLVGRIMFADIELSRNEQRRIVVALVLICLIAAAVITTLNVVF